MMDIQRLRNLTTGRLHTNMGHVYEDIDRLTGSPGVMTHMLPNALRAMTPWLRSVAPDERLWDGEYDHSHTGEIDVPVMTEDERSEFFRRFGSLPSPLEGEKVISDSLCYICGIGFRLPSGRCDHCDSRIEA